jgi:hypothetical protein
MTAQSKWAVLTPDGELTVHEGVPILEDLQAAVHGDVEAIASPFPDLPVAFYVNEERKARGNGPLPLNPKATTLLQGVLWPGQRLVGALVVSSLPDKDGDLSPMTDEQVGRLRELLA